jgi:uncharacterized membrane protein YgaE (UPF0421/DUF939 family)
MKEIVLPIAFLYVAVMAAKAIHPALGLGLVVIGVIIAIWRTVFPPPPPKQIDMAEHQRKAAIRLRAATVALNHQEYESQQKHDPEGSRYDKPAT